MRPRRDGWQQARVNAPPALYLSGWLQSASGKATRKMPDVLFHYTKAQTALEHILVEKRLRLSQFEVMNDPKESKELYVTTVTGVLSPKLGESWKSIQKALKLVKLKEWKVLCFSQNHPDYGSGKPFAEINPFLWGSNRPAMWAHYASSPNRSQDGVCLRFNHERLQKRISDSFDKKDKYFVGHGSVEYDDLRFLGYPPFNVDQIPELTELEIEERVREYYFEFYKEIFLLKAKDWQNEYEYRWLIHSRDDKPEYVSIDGVLEEVTVGEEFSKDYESDLVTLCKAMNVPVKRISWFNGMPDERQIYPV